MLKSRQWISTLVGVALSLAPINQTYAQVECVNTGGCGYQECRRAPCITPAVAFATIALIAVIAIALQNSGGGGSHSHCNSGSNNNCCCN